MLLCIHEFSNAAKNFNFLRKMYAIKKIQMDFFFFFFFIFYQRHIYILVNILLLIWWTILSFVVSFYRFNVILWKRMEIEEMRVSVYYMRVMRWKSPESYLKIRLRAILSTYDPIILMTSYWQASFDGFRWQIYKQKKRKHIIYAMWDEKT